MSHPLLSFLRRTRGGRAGLALATLLGVTTALAGAALLGLSGWFIVATAMAGSLVSFNVFTPSAGIRALTLLRTAARYGERLAGHDATLRLLAGLRLWFFGRMAALQPAQRGFERSGDLLNRVTSDIDALDTVYLRSYAPAVQTLISLLCFALLVWATGFAPLWLSLAPLPLALLLPLLVYRSSLAAGRIQADSTAALRTALIEGVQGARELAVFGGGPQIADRVETHSWNLVRAGRDGAAAAARGAAALTVGTRLLAVAVLGYGLASGGAQPVAAGLLGLAVLGTLGLLEPLGILPQAGQSLARAARAAEALDQLAGQSPLVPEPVPGMTLPAAPDLVIRGLSLRHNPQAPLVLDSIDLDIPFGSHLGLYGPSGEGKSSFCQVLLRLVPPSHGTVLLGGIDLARTAAASLRQSLAYLPQAPTLFDDSVAENLALAAPSTSEEEMWAALDMVELGDLFRRRGEGLECWVGEAGMRLSGGEAKRLGLAQILLRKAPITILDEPTGGLDRALAFRMMQRIHTAFAGRTMIIISHQPSDLAGCGRILRLQNGRLYPDDQG